MRLFCVRQVWNGKSWLKSNFGTTYYNIFAYVRFFPYFWREKIEAAAQYYWSKNSKNLQMQKDQKLSTCLEWMDI